MNQTLSNEIIINVTKKQDHSFDISWVSAVNAIYANLSLFVERNVTDVFDYTWDFLRAVHFCGLISQSESIA